MQTILIVVNKSAYGNESMFNALRLAITLKEQSPATTVRLFFLSDAVTSCLSGQTPSEGYNIQQMLEILLAQNTPILLCKTCCSTRGVSSSMLIDGIKIGTLTELSDWTLHADKVLTF